MNWFSANRPLIIGHRGASADAPENTLAAFGLAQEQGADGIELDARLTADGRVIVMHDATVARTTDGTGAVTKKTVAALQALDAGMGQPPPTLDQVFQTFGPSLLYNVELKEGGLSGRGLAAAVSDLIAAYHLENHVVVSSFNPLAVRGARRVLPRTTMVAVVREPGLLRFTRLLATTEADHPHYSLVDEAYMARAREQGWRVHVWTVDDPAGARRLASLGVHAIITNYPSRIRESLDL